MTGARDSNDLDWPGGKVRGEVQAVTDHPQTRMPRHLTSSADPRADNRGGGEHGQDGER
jgi:hypothetical protein